MKLSKKSGKKFHALIKLYGGFIILILVIGIIYWLTAHPFEPRYKLENYPSEDEQHTGSSVLGTTYNYYLDTSPSMMGFFEAENNSMSMLANVLTELNLDTHNNKFYTCYRDINNVSENDFYENMFSSEYSNQHYQNLIAQGGLWGSGQGIESGVSNESLEEELNNLDLSKIFTANYSNGQEFADNGTVNMIITDMNFLDRNYDVEYHNTLLERFADNLAAIAQKDNFCIYNIVCQFQGIQNVDEYRGKDTSNSSDNNHSFFIIILAQDNNVYNSYINKLERLFTKNQINYSDSKFELKNNLFENQNKFVIDRKKFTDLNNTTLENFNFDNQSVKKMPNNAVGVRFITKDSNTAAIRLQVASFELPGYVQNSEENRNESEVDTIIKIYYPNFLGYQEYTEESVIERSTAYLEWQDGKLWLIFEADFNIVAEVPQILFNKSYYIADVQFVMAKPSYTIPEWISSLNTDTVSEDWSKKIHINTFAAAVIEKKNEAYENSTSEYQRYMGNLLIYVNR